MNTAKTLATKEDLDPEDALHRLIAFERIRERSNQDAVCVWCGKPANGKQYPVLVHEAQSLVGAETWYRACSTAHSDTFTFHWMGLYNATLRPWRAIANARARRETTVAINEWPFNVVS